MKIALISFGSRGDLEPVAALGNALAERGHEVRVIANKDILDLGLNVAFDIRAIPLNVKQLLHEEGDRLLQAKSAVKSLKILSGIILNNLQVLSFEVFQQARDCDLILINERYYVLAQNFEEAGARVIQLCFQPKGATSDFPYLYFRPWYFRFLSNKLTHKLLDRMLLGKFLTPVNHMRRTDLRLPPLRLQEVLEKKWATPLLQGFSPSLFRRPADWPDHLVVCGNWSFPNPAEQSLPNELLDFLQGEEKTLCVGFGSMLYDVSKMRLLLENLAQKCRIKIVWLQNWTEQHRQSGPKSSEQLFVLNNCPHELLFTRVDAVWHHGGAGTVNTAARCGTPQLVSWFMLDQQFWAKRVQETGIGQNLGAFHALKPKKVEDALQQILGAKEISGKCRELASGIQQENGVQRTLEVMEERGWLEPVRTSDAVFSTRQTTY
ncbi:MAG TPA: glycosyltransferase [Saprospiraceae bacterium]|nr:glycosyltransferase [Saprospiraceae bacterium]